MCDRTGTWSAKRWCWGWRWVAVALFWPALAHGQGLTQFSDDPVTVHAFVSQGYIQSTENNYLARSKRGTLEFNEVGINFTKPITDRLRAGMQLFARDLGTVGNYTPHFDWFYLDYRFWDWLGIRAGRTKLPFGLYNENSDIDAARVPVLLPQSVYPIQNRDFLLAQTGAELYGDVPIGGAGSLEYRAYVGTIFLDTSSSAPTTASTRLDVPYLVGGRLMWAPPLEGLRLGASAQAMRLDFDWQLSADTLQAMKDAGTVSPNFSGLISAKLPAILSVGSVEYARDELLLAAEYSRWDVEIESSAPQVLPNAHVISERMYGMGSYRVLPWLSPGLYYSLLFPNVDKRSERQDRQHDVALTLRFDINDNLIFKAEGHYMHGTAGLNSALNKSKPLSELPESWAVFLAKATAYF